MLTTCGQYISKLIKRVMSFDLALWIENKSTGIGKEKK